MAHSAFLGTPPITDEDYWVARYILMSEGQQNPDPSKGSIINPPRPPASQYKYETRKPGILAVLGACIVIMLTITGMRLYVRARNKNLVFGLDDILIIPGVVGPTLSS